MFVAVYFWHVRPGMEEQFRAAWRRGTELITMRYGSFGSRLHRAADGRFVGYAEWPHEAAWQVAIDAHFDYGDAENARRFREAQVPSSERSALIKLTVCDDLLLRAK